MARATLARLAHDVTLGGKPGPATLVAAVVITDPNNELAKADPLGFLRRCNEHYLATYRDYSCTFIKQELLDKSLSSEQEMTVKFREQPYSVNMRWVRNAGAARQVTYIAGRWKDADGLDQAWCEPAGAIARLFISKIQQPIDGERARQASRRMLDQFGFAKTLQLIVRVSERAAVDKVLDLRYIGSGMIGERPTYVLERRLPYTSEKNPYPDRLLVIHIDKEWLLPTGCFSYADEAREHLLGKYVLTGVTFNNGYIDADFEPETLGR